MFHVRGNTVQGTSCVKWKATYITASNINVCQNSNPNKGFKVCEIFKKLFYQFYPYPL